MVKNNRGREVKEDPYRLDYTNPLQDHQHDEEDDKVVDKIMDQGFFNHYDLKESKFKFIYFQVAIKSEPEQSVEVIDLELDQSDDKMTLGD